MDIVVPLQTLHSCPPREGKRMRRAVDMCLGTWRRKLPFSWRRLLHPQVATAFLDELRMELTLTLSNILSVISVLIVIASSMVFVPSQQSSESRRFHYLSGRLTPQHARMFPVATERSEMS